MKTIDILYVFNSNMTSSDLILFIKNTNKSSYVFLTTHHLFDKEIEILNIQFPNKTIINIDFVNYIDEKQMQSFDDEAFKMSFKDKYFNNKLFKYLSLKNKNEYIKNKILKEYKFTDIYSENTLGLTQETWVNCDDEPKKKISFFKDLFLKIVRAFTKTVTINILKYKGYEFLFFGNIDRMRNIDNALFLQKNYNYLIFLFLLKLGYFKSFLVCFNKHNYDENLIKFSNQDIFMLVDGYLPPNYPQSSIELFRNITVVSDTYHGTEWFKRYNISIRSPFPFQKATYFNEVKISYNINKVILLMNHTGDWTSLINRSDDDILIESFCKLASNFKNIEFIIRLHPTAIHELHNGKEYNNRIANYIQMLNLKNLSISTKNLATDLKRGDLFVSEYSATLLDAISLGKLGVIANITKRRNFMQEFVDLGFIHVEKFEDLFTLISKLIQKEFISKIIYKHNNAVQKYNKKQKDYFKNDI
jgi:hypothetical protein